MFGIGFWEMVVIFGILVFLALMFGTTVVVLILIARLQPGRACPECGARANAGARVCPHCGALLDRPQTPTGATDGEKG